MEIQKYNTSVNKEHLLKILTQYNSQDPRTPIREYISNAYDACIGFEDAEILIWAERNKLCIEDTGSGMTKNILLEGFTRIAGHISRAVETESIGMFGIGVLSAFMVANTLTVQTRHDDDEYGWELIWRKNETVFTLRTIQKEQRGTLVKLHLDEDYLSLASNESLKSYVRKTFALLRVPIKIGSKPHVEIINPYYKWIKRIENEGEQKKLLLGNMPQQFFKEFSHVQLAAAYTSLNADGTRVFLGIPVHTYQRYDRQDIHFFSKGIQIEGKIREYFPPNLAFVIGVIESPNFRIQISREAINIEDIHFKNVRSRMEAHIIDFLRLIGKESPFGIESILREHGTMLISHYGPMRPQLIQILKEHYEFITSAGALKWKQILPFIFKKEDRKILYTITDSLGAYQDIFMKQTGKFIAVSALDADQVLLEEIASEEQVSLINVRTLEGIEGNVVEIPEVFRKFGTLLTRHLVRRGIGKVNFVNLPGEDQFPTFFRMKSGQSSILPVDENIEKLTDNQLIDGLMLNISHPFIQKLAGKSDILKEEFKEIADTLYFIAVMHSPFTGLLLEINKEIAASLIKKIELMTNLDGNKRLHPYENPTTFFAFPYSNDFHSVWEGVSEVLQENPYNWDIIRGDKQVDRPELRENISHHIQKSHRYIADISGLNKNVIYELGIMEGIGPNRTLIICDEETFPSIPADLKGRILKIYPSKLREKKSDFKNWFKSELGTLPWFENLQGIQPFNDWQAGIDQGKWKSGHKK